MSVFRSKIRVLVDDDISIDVGDISDVLSFKYEIAYCAKHMIAGETYIYIQHTTKMSPKILKRILAPLLIVHGTGPYEKLEGEVVESIGKFRKPREKHGRGDVPIVPRPVPKATAPAPSIPRIIREKVHSYPSPSTDAPEQILIIGDQAYSCRLLETPPLGTTFCAVYGSNNGLWGPRFWVGPVESIPPKDNTTVTPDMKTALLERQGNKCNECGTPVSMGSYSNSDADHVIPRSLGGKTTVGNLQAICVPCHRTKTALEHRGLKRRFADIELPSPSGFYMVSNDLSFKIQKSSVDPVDFIKDPVGMVPT